MGCIAGALCVMAGCDLRAAGVISGARPLVGDIVSSLVSRDMTGEG